MARLHFVGGEEREFISLTRDEVGQLASGELRLIGQLASSRDAFAMIAHEMSSFGCERVAELHPFAIQAHAAMLGLSESPDPLGSFDQGWRAINDVPPDH